MLLTIDIGTSTFKCAIWDYNGSRLKNTCVPLTINYRDGIKHETDPFQWQIAFEKCVKKTGALKSVEAIVISGNGPSLILVDKSGNPLVNARLWLDRRAQKYQDCVSKIMGGFVDASFFLPKILYIKNEENENYDKTKYFLGCPEYLAFILTGEAKNVFPCEGFDRWFWNDGILEKLDLDKSKFPSFIKPGEQFGTLNAKAAKKYGFSQDIPVISGGPDFFASILGSGVTKPGEICNRTGSSDGINLCVKVALHDKRFMSYSHPVPPYWNLSGVINTTGKAIEWGCGLLGVKGYDEFFNLAAKSAGGSNGLIFTPYLAGERSPLRSKEAKAVFNGMGLSTCKADIANSILEGIGFAVNDVLKIMEESGGEANRIHVTGGLCGSSFLNQIKADITGKEVVEGEYRETELLGLAVIGSCYMGKYASFKEASQTIVKAKKIYKPNERNKDLYNNLFNNYRNILQ